MFKRNETLFINMLKNFSECPRKFELAYLKNLKIPENRLKAQTGNKIHAVINYYLKGQNVEKLITCLDEEEKELWENFKKTDIGEPVASEYSFTVKLDDYYLGGRFDAIYKTSNGYLIADWKTGNFSFDEKSELQNAFYLFALYKIYHNKGLIKDFSELAMTYFVLKDNSSVNIRLNEELYIKYEKLISGMIKDIRNSDDFKKNTSNCKSCPYKNLCT